MSTGTAPMSNKTMHKDYQASRDHVRGASDRQSMYPHYMV